MKTASYRYIGMSMSEDFNNVEGSKRQISGYDFRSSQKLDDEDVEEQPIEIETFDKKGKFRGKIFIKNFEVIKYHSVIDYLNSGLNISTAFILDFTGSNGDPQDSLSLHYTKSGLNQYQKVMYLLGSILNSYDSKQKIFAYGFGAKVDQYSKEVSFSTILHFN